MFIQEVDSKPIAITSSSTFVVDISKFANPDDIKVDNFGIWKYSGSHPHQYRVYIDNNGHVQVDKCAPGATGNNVVYLRRLHSVHPSNKEFKRMIAFVSGKLYVTVHVHVYGMLYMLQYYTYQGYCNYNVNCN